MFKKIKDKWDKLDEGTKKAVKAGLVVTACAGSMYLGAGVAKTLINYEDKHKFDNYPKYGIEFDKDEVLESYFLRIVRSSKDHSKRKDLAGISLGSAEMTKGFFNECLNYISYKESVNEGLSECLDLITEMESE